MRRDQVAGSTLFVVAVQQQYTTKNPVIVMAADCLAAPRRNCEADSAAPWQRAPPLDHVQVAAVRAA